MHGDLNAAPFFGGWVPATILVPLSFTSRSWVTWWFLKVLDGVQKNVGEALAVMVIFLGQIFAGSSVFDLCAFWLAAFVVVLVRVYGLAGKAKGPAAAGPTPVVNKV